MADSKYGKYVITEPKRRGGDPNAGRTDAPGPDMLKGVVNSHDEHPEGAFMQMVFWIMKAYPDNIWARPHTHEFDETLNFFGSNPDDPKNLCGELELWLEDEKFLLTKSCTVFVPKGMKHALTVKRVDRPIFGFFASPAGSWERALV
jgi:hypothetical protein